MTFEMINWTAEEFKLAVAFNLKWVAFTGKNRYDWEIAPWKCELGGVVGDCLYAEVGGIFRRVRCVYNDLERLYAVGSTHIIIRWDGEVDVFSLDDDDETQYLVKGLFYLELLTPSVEAELNYFPSAHQKIEWTLEYEARLEAQNLSKHTTN